MAFDLKGSNWVTSAAHTWCSYVVSQEQKQVMSYYDYISQASDLPGSRYDHQISLPGDLLHATTIISDWLHTHVDAHAWRWGFEVQGDKVNVNMCVLSFKRKEDLVSFALTFT
jgi:hypothetical protein